MKLNASLAGFLLFFFTVAVLYDELQAASQIDKERLQLGFEAGRSAARALQALQFVSWASKIGTVAGPLMSVALLVVDIVFSFLGIESPEMILMKSEFKNLNTRLDSFSVQFEEVKKKIDWSAIQLKYEKHESTIRVLNKDREKLASAKTAKERDAQKAVFIRKYEKDFQLATEALYQAMTSETILSDNIFEASAKYTDQHPELTFHFMQGCVQLLLQGMTIQATYIHLKYDSAQADDYFKKVSDEKMAAVAKQSKKVYYRLQGDFHPQIKKDINRIALQNTKIAHNQMTRLLYDYLRQKYIKRMWFVFVYNPVSTYEKHAVHVCSGAITFRVGGRNFVVASQDIEHAKTTGWSVKWAQGVLSSFGEFRQDHDGARGVLNRVMARAKDCAPAAAIAVCGFDCKGSFISPNGHSTQQLKTVKWCNTDLCWVWKKRHYAAIMFG